MFLLTCGMFKSGVSESFADPVQTCAKSFSAIKILIQHIFLVLQKQMQPVDIKKVWSDKENMTQPESLFYCVNKSFEENFELLQFFIKKLKMCSKLSTNKEFTRSEWLALAQDHGEKKAAR